MSRTLAMKLFVHEENGLCLTVTRTTVEQNNLGEKETTKTEKTDKRLPSSVCSAVEELVTEYLSDISGDVGDTEIEKAARA